MDLREGCGTADEVAWMRSADLRMLVMYIVAFVTAS